MGDIVTAVFGWIIAAFGFLVMRNRTTLALLSPHDKGYYQRVLLDAWSRNSTRGSGALSCLVGVSIATDTAGTSLQAPYLQVAATGIWFLMSLTIAALLCLGVAFLGWRLLRGKSLGWSDWLVKRQREIESGPIDVSSQVTARMNNERRLFTVGLIAVVVVAAGAAIVS